MYYRYLIYITLLCNLGLALLQRNDHFTEVHEDMVEAPEERIHEAVVYHPFAEAAYTVL